LMILIFLSIWLQPFYFNASYNAYSFSNFTKAKP
jgi:hypothetical protein